MVIVAGAWFLLCLGLGLTAMIFVAMCVVVVVEYAVTGLVALVRVMRGLAR